MDTRIFEIFILQNNNNNEKDVQLFYFDSDLPFPMATVQELTLYEQGLLLKGY